jgi:hypothetical protein
MSWHGSKHVLEDDKCRYLVCQEDEDGPLLGLELWMVTLNLRSSYMGRIRSPPLIRYISIGMISVRLIGDLDQGGFERIYGS